MRNADGHSREWFFVWAWAALAAAVMLLPYLRRAEVVRRHAGERFTGIISAELVDTAYHLSWVRQARDGEWLFESKYAGADARGARFVNALFLGMGLLARLLDLSVVEVFHFERTLAAAVVLVAAYWLAAQFFRDRRMRWTALVLVTTSAGLQGVFTLGQGGRTLENLFLPETVTFWSLEWWVVIGPATATLLLSLVTAHRALGAGPRSSGRGLLAVGAAGFLQAAVYPHHVVTALLVVAALVAVRAATAADVAARREDLRRGARVLAAMLVGAAPILAYHAAVLLGDPSYWAYAGQADEYLTASFIHWPEWFGVVLVFAVVGAGAIVRRRERADNDEPAERDRLLLVVWPVVVLALVATPFPPTQRVHLYHGLHVALCLLATRGLWAFEKRCQVLFLKKVPDTFFLAVIIAVASVTNVVHFVTELGDFSPTEFASIRETEAAAIDCLDARAGSSEVIAGLAGAVEGVPMWTGSRVFVGHPNVSPRYEWRAGQMEQLMGKKGPVERETLATLLAAAKADYVYVDRAARLMGAGRTERTLVAGALAERVYANRHAAVYRVRRNETADARR